MSIWGVIFGIIGARALPRHHELEPGLGDPRALVRAVRRLVGRARDLGRDPARRARGRLGRAPLREQRAADDGRGRAGAPARPGDRPLGQLVEPGALRQAHDASVGARDPRQGEGRTSTTRPSSTSFCGTSSASRCCSGSTGASRSGGPGSSRSTSRSTRRSACSRSTLRIDPSNHFLGQRINFWVALVCFVGEHRILHLVAVPADAEGRRAEARETAARFPRGRAWPSRVGASGRRRVR